MADNKDKKKDKKPISFRRRLFIWCFNLFLFCIVGVALYVGVIYFRMPSLDAILNETRAPAIVFLDKNGAEIRSSNRIMGTPVSTETLPPHVWQAIVAIEDKRFFEHGPIDMRGTLRALILNLVRGKFAVGGSSITQQTAKNIFLSRDKKISRKVQELILSYWLENRFDKSQILDLYMNRVSLVGGLRGIDAAARALFGRSATELSIAQSAQIAAMLKAPTTYNPYLNPAKNMERARTVLQEMANQGYIDIRAAHAAAAELSPAPGTQDTNLFRYWTDFVTDELNSQIGIMNTDVFVHTTLDSNIQNKITNAISSHVGNHQGAAVAMTHDGAIRAMVGGTDYKASQFNRTTAHRQPGSAFKPIVYLVALENGMTPETTVNDSPFAIGDYNPKNYNEHYYGDITLATAFAKSVNSVPLKLASLYGLDSVVSMAGRLGVGNRLRHEFSTVLGASEMTLLDLTNVYAVIWNGGESVRPYSITRVTDVHGNTLYERNPSDSIQILTPRTVGHMTNMLAAVTSPSGTGHYAMAPNVIGGKTGTSNDNRDAWFIGATKDIVLGIWVGNDDYTPMESNVTGGTVPAKIFRDTVK